jgi:ribosomal protein S18 acetylase RimI-like enzyme
VYTGLPTAVKYSYSLIQVSERCGFQNLQLQMTKATSSRYGTARQDNDALTGIFGCAHAYGLDDCNLALRKRVPRRIPGVKLECLHVDMKFQGEGLGEPLFVNTLARAQRIYRECIRLFVDAFDDRVACHYRYFVFLSVPDNPLLLFFPAAFF